MSDIDAPASPEERETLARLLLAAGQLAQLAGISRERILVELTNVAIGIRFQSLIPEGLKPAQPAKVLALAVKEQAPCSA